MSKDKYLLIAATAISMIHAQRQEEMDASAAKQRDKKGIDDDSPVIHFMDLPKKEERNDMQVAQVPQAFEAFNDKRGKGGKKSNPRFDRPKKGWRR